MSLSQMLAVGSLELCQEMQLLGGTRLPRPELLEMCSVK